MTEQRIPVVEQVVLRLYIAGGAPNSVLAIANLHDICSHYLEDNFKLEIVDVLETPLRALEDGILATPTLVRLAPLPEARAIGNLSNRAQVLAMLRLI